MKLPRLSVRQIRVRPRHLVYAAAGVATLAGAGVIALGPAAPWLVDHIADGRKVWRLGKLNIEGVRGAGLGDLTIARITLTDEQGVWAEAENITLRWRPLDIAGGAVNIDSVDAQRLHILRRPALSAPEPRSGASLDVMLTALKIARVELDRPVADVPAVFKLDLGLGIEHEAVRALNLALMRLDSDADRATVRFADTGQTLTLDGDVTSDKGGILARLIGVEDEAVRIEANAQGDLTRGAGDAHATIGETPVLNATMAWQGATWRVTGDANHGAVPLLDELESRVGPTMTFSGEGEREGRFAARMEAPNLVATLEGDKTQGFSLAGPARVTADTRRLAQLAPEILVGGGHARAEAVLDMTDERAAFAAQVVADAIDIGGQIVPMAGPVRAVFTDRSVDIDANLNAGERAPALFARSVLKVDVAYDRQRSRFGIDRISLDGPSILATAQGWTAEGDGEFSGEWRVRRIEALAPDMRGDASGNWRMRADPERGWVGAVNGRASGLRGEPAFAPELLGQSPTLDASFGIKDGVITVSHARVTGARLRAGATGAIRNGNADLRLEASARGPVSFGAARLDGATDATGRITGDLGRPRISATAQLDTVDLGGVAFTQPAITLTLAPVSGNAYRGTVEATGQVNQQTARATSDIAIDRGGISFPTLVADIGGLHAEGSARFADRGPTADVMLSGRIDNLAPGAAGRVDGHAVLTPQNVQLEAQLTNARIGDLRMEGATVSATGPYDNVAARFSVRGAINRAPLTLNGTGAFVAVRGGNEMRIEGAGTIAGATFLLRKPATARWRNGVLEASLDSALDDGSLVLSYRDSGRALRGEADLTNAPIGPIVAIWGERGSGRMSGHAELASAGSGLTGALNLALDDARFARRSTEAVSGRVTANLTRDRLTGRVEAHSSGGLDAVFEADAPVVTSVAPVRIALAPERQGRATWSVHGPVAGLWAAARMNDQSLEGDVDGEGSLRFGGGAIAGDGEIAIRNGRFEDKLSGVKLQAIDTLVRFGASGAQIERFSAQDGRGGTMTATGGAADPEHGNIAITLTNIRLVDRPDAHARANGSLAFTWEGLTSALRGNLNITEGDVSIAQAATASTAQLDVIEINRPGFVDETLESERARPRAGVTTLDIRVRSNGRVFTRGRGIDAEWALNLRLRGDVARPQLFGEARLIRGALRLTGRPFELAEDSTISFDGDPLQARVDLSAERETADLTARIRITGYANDPEIAFESDPSLPEDEILPQILFGRSVEDLSALEAAQLAASFAQLSGQSSFSIADTARAISGLDRLDVREDEGGGLLVAGGLYLSREVYLEVARTGLGQAQTNVEWRIRPRLLLITSFLPNGDQRASIRWRRETDGREAEAARTTRREERRQQRQQQPQQPD